MAAKEGLGVQRDLDVGRVGDGVTDQDQIGDGWLLRAVGALLTAVNTNVTRAMQHLREQQFSQNFCSENSFQTRKLMKD